MWVAVSDDVPGLVTEAESMDTLMDRLLVMVPELVELSEVGPAPYAGAPFELTFSARREPIAA